MIINLTFNFDVVSYNHRERKKDGTPRKGVKKGHREKGKLKRKLKIGANYHQQREDIDSSATN